MIFSVEEAWRMMHAIMSIYYDGHALLLHALYFLSRNDYRRCLIFNAAYSLFIVILLVYIIHVLVGVL